MFFTKYNREPFSGRENSGVVKPEFSVQKYGFITIEDQINRLLASGVNLERYRLEKSHNSSFDYPDGVFSDDDADVEHVRDLNYDLVDYSKDLEYLESKAKIVTSTDNQSLQKVVEIPEEHSEE